MPEAELYELQTELAVRALRYVVPEACFALKGGTAINLFVRDMPRLSVDIDLAFVPVTDRESSLRELDEAMRRIAAAITDSLEPIHASLRKPKPGMPVTRFFVSDRGRVRIKVEVSPVQRGCVHPPGEKALSPRALEAYGPLRMRVLSVPDLYASKLVAALDRQHPRDLFDVHFLFREGGGIDDRIREAFIVYLIGHNRPMHEVLSPRRKRLPSAALDMLDGMNMASVNPADLQQAFKNLVSEITEGMSNRHRRFLLSFEKGQPDWQLLEVAHARTLPAVRWRMRNLDTLTADRRSKLVADLETVLDGNGLRNDDGGRHSPLEIPDPLEPPSPWDD